MTRYVVLILLFVILTGTINKEENHTLTSRAGTTENEKDSLAAEVEPTIDTTLLQIDFCGDLMPLKESHVARRYHNAVKQYSHPGYARYNKQIAGELKIISKILKQYNLPSDLKYIPVVESNCTADAVSPKGAGGYWQLMPQTAIALGLRVDDIVDERKDLVKSTHAAARYLKWLYGELGNWTLAAAAYNVGPGSLIRQMTAQKRNSFYSLRLNNETSRYVYKIVAIKELYNTPERSNSWVSEDFLASVTEFHKRQVEREKSLLQKNAADISDISKI